MPQIKLFLAHTDEVKNDIEKIQNIIYKKYQKDKEVKIVIEHWTDADKGLSLKRFQDRLNELLGTCEILYIFFHKKIGEYTKEEFDFGLNRFKNAEKPYSISLFFKKFEINDNMSDDEWNQVQTNREFKKEIQKLHGNQYTHSYRDIDDLEKQLLKQLEIDIKKPIPKKPIPTILDELLPKEEKIKIYLKENVVIPPRDRNFVSREAEIQLTLKYLINKKQYAITGVIGNGGIGKSAIANEVIHIIQDSWREKWSDYLKEKVFMDGIMWIKLEQEQTLELVFEEQIIKQLGVKLSLKNFDMELHKLLLGKDILIILDSAEQNQPIFNELMKLFKNYPILITSRKKYAGIKMLELDTLDDKESFDLFQNHLDQVIPKEEEESITKFCVETLGGLPLAIKIIANYMKESGRKLSEIKQNLLSIKIDDPFGEETVSVDSVFELSYSTLTPNAQKVFAMGSVFIYPFKEEYLLEIAKRNEGTSSITQEIDSLMKINLIERNGDLYSYHPLLREYALKKLYSFAFSEAIFEAYKEHLVYLSANETNLPIIHDELLSVLEDDYRKENYERVFKIIKNLDGWLNTVGFYARREDLLLRGYQKAQTLEDKKNEYYFLKSYADTLDRKGKREEAKIYFQKALEFEEAKEDFWLHYSLATIEYNLKNYQDSYTKNLEFSREALSLDKRDNYGSFLNTNGSIYNAFFKYDFALKYAKAVNFSSQFRSNKFKTLNNLIKVHYLQSNFQKALNYIERMEAYLEDENFDLADKLALKTIKCWVYLYTKNSALLPEIAEVEKYFNRLLELKNDAYDTLKAIEGLYYIQTENFSKAKQTFEQIEEEKNKKYGLAIYESHTHPKKAKAFVESLLQQEKLSIEEIAESKLYLAKIYIAEDNQDKAIKLLCEAQLIFKEYMNPIQKAIEKEIMQSVDTEAYIKVKSNSELEKIDESFFLESLPKTIQAKDNKEMVLIPQGFSIFGEDNFAIPSTDEIFDNVEMILDNDKKLQSILYLGNFYIDKEAVTNEEYIAYCQESRKEIPSNLENLQPNESVKNLLLTEMQEYAEFYGKVLPLPEEWEKACRGEENFNYPWGNEWNESIEIGINQTKVNELEEYFIENKTYKEYYNWFQNYISETKMNLNYYRIYQLLFEHKTYQDYYAWFEGYKQNINSNITPIDYSIHFPKDINIDKLYFSSRQK